MPFTSSKVFLDSTKVTEMAMGFSGLGFQVDDACVVFDVRLATAFICVCLAWPLNGANVCVCACVCVYVDGIQVDSEAAKEASISRGFRLFCVQGRRWVGPPSIDVSAAARAERVGLRQMLASSHGTKQRQALGLHRGCLCFTTCCTTLVDQLIHPEGR